MAKKPRPCIIAGNWKMYKTIDQTLSFIDQIAPIAEKSSCQVFLAVPFTAIKQASEHAQGTKIIIGAQNMNDATEGAFTGEVAALMLKDAGAQFVILGHSERRAIFHETNDFINRKVKRALASDLQAILCIGETFEERQNKQTEEVLKLQLEECLAGVKKEAAKLLIIAYEPRWAIGTGLSASVKDAESASQFCKKVLQEILGAKVPLLYGGSVVPDNAEGYLASDDLDGLLIGSASLQSESFAKILTLRENRA